MSYYTKQQTRHGYGRHPHTSYQARSTGGATTAESNWIHAPMSPWEQNEDEYGYDEYEVEAYDEAAPSRYVVTETSDPTAAMRTHMMPILIGIVMVLTLLFSLWLYLRAAPEPAAVLPVAQPAAIQPMPAQVQTAVALSDGRLSAVFMPSVQYWVNDIVRWADTHQLDPNMVATVMQIESCGDPAAVSVAGAQGLFQVMPYHFTAGENMTDPDTNAKRGMGFLSELTVMFDGDTGLSLAGYNGGPGNAVKPWEQWPNETQRYFVWGTGIYSEATAEATSSATLQRWLDAGGRSLCQQAENRLGISP